MKFKVIRILFHTCRVYGMMIAYTSRWISWKVESNLLKSLLLLELACDAVCLELWFSTRSYDSICQIDLSLCFFHLRLFIFLWHFMNIIFSFSVENVQLFVWCLSRQSFWLVWKLIKFWTNLCNKFTEVWFYPKHF